MTSQVMGIFLSVCFVADKYVVKFCKTKFNCCDVFGFWFLFGFFGQGFRDNRPSSLTVQQKVQNALLNIVMDLAEHIYASVNFF